ncbi:hypothetical protein [Dietzia sp. WMMA184]|uniref:hypothetical protein n=1 Tax=Dietzia sp. WMMA184 TaxID=2039808 RepID=UPI000BDEFBA7|nr:hypothetical protein [Dietzia sp. WMMA184]
MESRADRRTSHALHTVTTHDHASDRPGYFIGELRLRAPAFSVPAGGTAWVVRGLMVEKPDPEGVRFELLLMGVPFGRDLGGSGVVVCGGDLGGNGDREGIEDRQHAGSGRIVVRADEDRLVYGHGGSDDSGTYVGRLGWIGGV